MGRFNYKSIGICIGLGCILLTINGCSLFSLGEKKVEEAIEDTKIDNMTFKQKPSEEVVSKDKMNVNQDIGIEYHTNIDDAIKEEYINTLKEDERYIFIYTSNHSGELLASESGNGPVKLHTIDALIKRLEKADMDFYIPQYIPDGYKLKDIGIYYYLNYDNFSRSMLPIREEILTEGVRFEVYKIEENYENSVEKIYLSYTNGTDTITYRFGLDFGKASDHGEKKEQFVKEEYSKISSASWRFQVNQNIEPKEVFTGVPLESHYDSPDYFNSIQMSIDGDGITDEDVLKIANSIYKCN